MATKKDQIISIYIHTIYLQKWSNIETHSAEVAGEDFFVFLSDELEELHVLAQVLVVETSLQIFDERLDAE